MSAKQIIAVALGIFVLVAAVIAISVSIKDKPPQGDNSSGQLQPKSQGGGDIHAGGGVADLLKQAEEFRVQRRFREAEIQLTKAIQINRRDIRVWRALAAVQRDMSAASIAVGNLLSAGQEADRAQNSVNGLRAQLIDPESPSTDPKVLLDEEHANAAAADAVRVAIDLACQKHIAKGDGWADDAYHNPMNALAGGLRNIRNERPKVVEGLKELKMVFELGPWGSESTRTSAIKVYSKLKKLVDPEEWNDLLAQAGFDPGSRETVKKWGLE